MSSILKNAAIKSQTPLNIILFTVALVAALFFRGEKLEYLAFTLIVMLIWLGRNFAQAYTSGFHLPKTMLTLSLFCFWLWLAISLNWSVAFSNSVIFFWWFSVLPLVFLIYTLEPHQDKLWLNVSAIMLVIGCILALVGIYQYFTWNHLPTSLFITRNTHAAFLNLIALPAAAFFLYGTINKHASLMRTYLSGLLLFILYFSIVLTNSRGGMLSLTLATIILLLIATKIVPKRGIAGVFFLLLLAFCIATAIPSLTPSFSEGGLISSSRALHDPTSRLMIWGPAWKMLMESPWLGIGLGNYFLAWPPYKAFEDTTAGFFVHNDYLQLWIEIGLPGIILLILVMMSVAVLKLRILQNTNIEVGKKLEIAGLFCGLFAVACHSFVDYNFYILAILLTSGLVLGRFHILICRYTKSSRFELYPAKYISKKYFLFCAILILLLPLPYLAGIGIGNHYSGKALTEAKQGLLEEANKSFDIAKRFAPNDDRILTGHADLYRQALGQLTTSEHVNRKQLYQNAVNFLDKAEEINPLRWVTPMVRGKLHHDNPELTGEHWQEISEHSYKRALTLNPKLYKTRVDYAEILISDNRHKEAFRILNNGIGYTYIDNPDLIPYYQLTKTLSRNLGRNHQVQELEQRLGLLQKRLSTSRHVNTLYGY